MERLASEMMALVIMKIAIWVMGFLFKRTLAPTRVSVVNLLHLLPGGKKSFLRPGGISRSFCKFPPNLTISEILILPLTGRRA